MNEVFVVKYNAAYCPRCGSIWNVIGGRIYCPDYKCRRVKQKLIKGKQAVAT